MVSCIFNNANSVPMNFVDAAAEERDPENFDPTRNLRGKLVHLAALLPLTISCDRL